MSIREKEELLRQAARNWEQAAEEHKKAGEYRKAAEALRNAARNWEKTEEVHPIGYFNAMSRRLADERMERIRKLEPGPGGPKIGDN